MADRSRLPLATNELADLVDAADRGGAWDDGGCDGPAQEQPLLRFYDRLRRRILAASARSRLGRSSVEVLLAVPDLFVLLLRLGADREVPAESRRLIAGALAYFLLPVDLLPEAVLGGAGFLDDVVLAAAVLSHALGDRLEPIASRHWSGAQGVRATVHGIADAAHAVLGARLHARVRRFLAARGIELARAAERASSSARQGS